MRWMQICALCRKDCYGDGMTETATGLRARKKQQTRLALAQAGLRLFAERGYDETTLKGCDG